ncbi:FkbM family methyltransferase [Pseudonocardia broussonetiae]|uniref:FkbM family methyltransferase n=1 Tax=Pseudonocardia broussonetiae TaxID=2736640 RepID=A0A6M6JIM2_9PSEU|nr:FkbM family methyltransferase [Pseudonocardia broussonetiae]QJY47868.1 FkbM family methyltransferase [Pseudonocardia broussonetiae]
MNVLHSLIENILDVKRLGFRFLLRHLRRLATDDGGVVTVTVRDVGRLTIRNGSHDVNIVREIFREDQYRITSPVHDRQVDAAYEAILESGKQPLIIDAGANNGASAVWFARRYPRAVVVAVEPDPGNAAVCRANTAGFDIRVRQAAVGSTGGFVSLVTDGRESDAIGTRREVAGNVPILTVPEIVADQGDECELFLVKIDIEGSEADLFSADTEWVGQASAMFVEPHDYLYPGQGVTSSLRKVTATLDLDLLVERENLVFVRR